MTARKPTATPDTSVVVAGLCAWHPSHEFARAALARRPRVVAHVLLESYSVLTRLPPQQRVEPGVVRDALLSTFSGEPIQLAPQHVARLIDLLGNNSIGGGATYDALVASTALHAGLKLQSLDSRARPTYAAVGVDVEWLGGEIGGSR